jgi:hypothetical protein
MQQLVYVIINPSQNQEEKDIIIHHFFNKIIH